MMPPSTQIPISSIILDESIYPGKTADHRRVAVFAENFRDGFDFDPIELAPCPDQSGFYRVYRLSIPRDRIAKRLGLDQKTIHHHLGKMPILANSLNDDLSWGFTAAQVAEKHGRTVPMVWSLALDPMAGGGVTPVTCPAMGRRCRAFDMEDRPDTRPEIETFTWEIPSDQGLSWLPSASPRALFRPCRKATSRGLPSGM